MIWVLVVVNLRYWVVMVDINVGSWCCGWTWVRGAVGSSSRRGSWIEICGVVDFSLIFYGFEKSWD